GEGVGAVEAVLGVVVVGRMVEIVIGVVGEVAPAFHLELVVTGAAVEVVGAEVVAAVQGVVAILAEEEIGAAIAVEVVVASAAEQVISAVAAVQIVVARTAEAAVVAAVGHGRRRQ